tara:strand:- start:293 stop:844 length:552 start_codon:yes stop_codon:yes gene_type:complete
MTDTPKGPASNPRASDPDIATTAEAHEADAMPRAHAVHADPDARPTAEQQALPARMAEPAQKKSPAQWAYERLILYIKNFEEQLDDSQEIAMGFTGGQMGVLKIEGMGYFDPDIVTFYGSEPGGARTQLIQHVSQLNVMLRALPKPGEAEKPRRIGFRLARELQDDDTPDADTVEPAQTGDTA